MYSSKKAVKGLENLISKMLGVIIPVFLLLIIHSNAKAADFVSPVADFTYSNIGDLYVLFTDKSYDPDTSVVERYWDFGDGTFAQASTIYNKRYSHKGIYQVKIEVVDATGLRNSVTKEVTVDGPELTPPTAYFYYTVSGKTVNFTDSSSDHDGKIVEWYWDLGDGAHKTMEKTFSHTYGEGGLYKVVLEVVDDSGLRNKLTRDVVVVSSTNVAPVAAFSYTSNDNSVTFKDESYDTDKKIVEWYWDLGDGKHLSNVQNFTHIYKFGGTYKVKLEVVDSTSLRKSIEKTLTVTGPSKQAPIADFYYSSGDKVTFGFGDSSTTDNGQITQWYWDLGDGTHVSMQKEVVHKYIFAGSYTVKLEVVDEAGLRSIKEKTIEAVGSFYDPYVTFTKDLQEGSLTVTYHSDAVSFNGQITEIYWDFGDGVFAKNVKDVTHTYTNNGIYTVKLEVVDNYGARGTYQETIVVTKTSLGVPKAYFTYYNDQKTPKFIFYDQSTSPNKIIVERYWDFGDGVFAENQQVVEHTYQAPGIYNVKLEVVDILGERNTYSVSLIVMSSLF